jgi:hypothetical protein
MLIKADLLALFKDFFEGHYLAYKNKGSDTNATI